MSHSLNDDVHCTSAPLEKNTLRVKPLLRLPSATDWNFMILPFSVFSPRLLENISSLQKVQERHY